MSGNTPSSIQCAFCQRAIYRPVTAANANAEPVHESCLVNSMVDEMDRIDAREPSERRATLTPRRSN